MVRTQILLTEEQAKQLRELAATEGRSMADVVRDGIDLLLRTRRTEDRKTSKSRSIEALGRFHSGVPDLGSEHDGYLSEVFRD